MISFFVSICLIAFMIRSKPSWSEDLLSATEMRSIPLFGSSEKPLAGTVTTSAA